MLREPRTLLRDGNSLLKADGLCVHQISLADHSYRDDAGICRVNFLRFSDDEWRDRSAKTARHQYENRLRSSQYPPIFETAGFDVLEIGG